MSYRSLILLWGRAEALHAISVQEKGKAGSLCFGFGFQFGKQKAKAKLWRPKGMGTCCRQLDTWSLSAWSGSLPGHAGASAYFNCTSQGKWSFSNCCIHFIFSVIPFYIFKKINSVLWVISNLAQVLNDIAYQFKVHGRCHTIFRPLAWNHLRHPDTKHPSPTYQRENKITDIFLLYFKSKSSHWTCNSEQLNYSFLCKFTKQWHLTFFKPFEKLSCNLLLFNMFI